MDDYYWITLLAVSLGTILGTILGALIGVSLALLKLR